MTSKVYIIHSDGNCLRFYGSNGMMQSLSLKNHDMHSYLRRDKLYVPIEKTWPDTALSALMSNMTPLKWKEEQHVIDPVHEHVCGHSTYKDIKLLLQRNKLWDEQCNSYLSHILETCQHCLIITPPSGMRPVSLRTMSRGFNDVVCVDHMDLAKATLFHVMDAVSRYSSGCVVDTPNMEPAIDAFDSTWISQFWSPGAVVADKAFQNSEFTEYLQAQHIKIHPIPLRRHNKNVLDSKYRVIRDVYLCLESAQPDQDKSLPVQQALRISNDLHGNDVASSHELAKGYTRPLASKPPVPLPSDVGAAHQELTKKRKLNAILRSKAVKKNKAALVMLFKYTSSKVMRSGANGPLLSQFYI